MAGRIKVARLSEDQIDAATRLVAEVFVTQLRTVGFEPDHDQQKAYRDGFLGAVRFVFAHGEPYAATIDDEMAGVALWMPPHASEATDEEEQEFGITKLEEIFEEPFGGLYELDRKLRDLRIETVRKRPHWVLVSLNISPLRRGQGISGPLLQPILFRAD